MGAQDVANRDAPVVIDTPLARIDRQHQHNLITRYFPQAGRQVIVLPTDSELDREKYELIRSHVYREFRLENQAGMPPWCKQGVLLMAKIYTSQADEDTISLVLRKGFRAQGPKWTVLRLALALSLRQSDLPDETSICWSRVEAASTPWKC